MRRLLLIGLTILLVSVFALPAAAIPTSDLASMASYYPANAVFYVGFRTDQAFIDTLDGVISRVEQIGDPSANGSNLLEGLDEAAQTLTSNPSATFLETFRPLLGNIGAVGTTDAFPLIDEDPTNDDKAGIGVALQITDRAGVTALLQDMISANDANAMFVVESTDTADTIVPSDSNQMPVPYYFYVGNDVLLVGNTDAVLNSVSLTNTLAGSEDFNSTISQLPNGDYNIAAYLAIGPIARAQITSLEAMTADMPELDAQMAQLDALSGVYDSINGVAIGFVILEEVHFTMDFYASIDSSAYLEQLGISPDVLAGFTPFDPAFASRLPADAAAVILSSNLGANIDNSLSTNLQMMGDMQGMGAEELEAALNQINFVLRGATGLTLDEITASLNGQFALGLSINPEALMAGMMGGGESTADLFGFGLVFENVDGGVQPLYDGIAQAVQQFLPMAEESGITLEALDVQGGSGWTITIPPQTTDLSYPLLIQMAVNDSVFVLGTPDYVTQALSADGGLAADASFQSSLSTSLPGAPAFLYLAPSAVSILDLVARGTSANEGASSVGAILDSLNISSGLTAEGSLSAAGRAVITLQSAGE